MRENFKDYILKIKDKIIDKNSALDDMEDINLSLENAEARKTNLLLQMGILTHKMIRENRINDECFNDLCEEILELDKFIYQNKVEFDTQNDIEYTLICECGNNIGCSDKFCSECGNQIEDKSKYENTIICPICECNIDIDSIYCTCCGNKIL